MDSPTPEPPPGRRPRTRLAVRLGVATLGRLFLNTARRFPYPFAAVLARELAVPLTGVTAVIAACQATGLLSPLFGPLGDRWGYRALMLGGLGLLAVGMAGPGLVPTYPAVAAGLVLASLGKSIFDPAVQAYIGEQVPLHRRGLAVGLAETAWAGASLVGIPAVGLLMETVHWRAPFLILGVLGAAAAAGLWQVMEAGPLRPATGHRAPSAGRAWGALLRNPAALAGLAFGFLISAANDNLFVVYGVWLGASFSLGPAALGAATAAIGVAEISGEGLTALLGDRIGLRRAVLWGAALSALAYAALPALGHALPAALGGLFLVFVTYEFTIVTSFSLLTEALPEARGTMMSAYVAATGLGRVAGATLGGPLWTAGGLWATGLTSAAVGALAAAVLARGCRIAADGPSEAPAGTGAELPPRGP
ncbi:MAG: MFS transporter [Deferrisomatales bacterium]